MSRELWRGTPAATWVDYANRMSQDMIVMTTHGRFGVRWSILRSVAEALVRLSGDPVLLIPGKHQTLYRLAMVLRRS